MELLNVVMRQGVEDKFGCDSKALKILLENAGFTDVRRVDYSVGVKKELLIDREDRASESLRVEAIK